VKNATSIQKDFERGNKTLAKSQDCREPESKKKGVYRVRGEEKGTASKYSGRAKRDGTNYGCWSGTGENKRRRKIIHHDAEGKRN